MQHQIKLTDLQDKKELETNLIGQKKWYFPSQVLLIYWHKDRSKTNHLSIVAVNSEY